MTQIAPRDLALLVTINLIWGFNLIASKVGVEHFPPVLFVTLRFALLALILLPFLRWHAGGMQRLLVASALSGGLQFALLFIGLDLSAGVSQVAIATQLGVPFTTLLSVMLLGEVIRWRRWLGITLAFAGVVVIGFQPGLLENRAGLLLVVASTLVGSLGLVAVKSLGTQLRPLELQAWSAWTGLPVLVGLTLMLESGQWEAVRIAGALEWSALLYTTLGASLVSHTAFYWLVARYPVTSIAPLTVLSPIFGVAFGVLLLGDQLTPRILLGGLLTLTGVVIIAYREKRLVDTGS
ncbi:MAG: DMT family transporter [Steroidobacteraceae bacterium]|nr:DMT family transporter [Steroidobacteraceae bacterium]